MPIPPHTTQPSSEPPLIIGTLTDRNAVLNATIEACIVALGSNSHAKVNLTLAQTALSKHCKKSIWSTPFVNADYTATSENPKPDYTNQCGYLAFDSSNKWGIGGTSLMLKNSLVIENMTLVTFITRCKEIEQRLKRSKSYKKGFDKVSSKSKATHSYGNVSIDIDILCVQIDGQWRTLQQRYPFKGHERLGIIELQTFIDTCHVQ